MNLKKIKDNKGLKEQIVQFLESAIVDADFPFTYKGKDCLIRVRPDSQVTIALYVDDDRKFKEHDDVEMLDMNWEANAIMETLERGL